MGPYFYYIKCGLKQVLHLPYGRDGPDSVAGTRIQVAVLTAVSSLPLKLETPVVCMSFYHHYCFSFLSKMCWRQHLSDNLI